MEEKLAEGLENFFQEAKITKVDPKFRVQKLIRRFEVYAASRTVAHGVQCSVMWSQRIIISADYGRPFCFIVQCPPHATFLFFHNNMFNIVFRDVTSHFLAHFTTSYGIPLTPNLLI